MCGNLFICLNRKFNKISLIAFLLNKRFLYIVDFMAYFTSILVHNLYGENVFKYVTTGYHSCKSLKINHLYANFVVGDNMTGYHTTKIGQNGTR